MDWLDPARLARMAEDHGSSYRSAEPFPHIVIDDFLPADVLQAIIDEFPQPGERHWIEYDRDTECKLANGDERHFGPVTRSVLSQFNSATFCNFLHRLTGIPKLIPDPYFLGGGLHQIERGGFLKVHADFNSHDELGLDRRLNLLLYLNQDWEEEYGGHLELWDRGMVQCEKRVLPIANRCVIFTTTETSFHGHPDPLSCPDDRTRRSLALYYYTNGRPEEEMADCHTTVFRTRPGERFGSLSRKMLHAILPPFMSNTFAAVRRSVRRRNAIR